MRPTRVAIDRDYATLLLAVVESGRRVVEYQLGPGQLSGSLGFRIIERLQLLDRECELLRERSAARSHGRAVESGRIDSINEGYLSRIYGVVAAAQILIRHCRRESPDAVIDADVTSLAEEIDALDAWDGDTRILPGEGVER